MEDLNTTVLTLILRGTVDHTGPRVLYMVSPGLLECVHDALVKQVE